MNRDVSDVSMFTDAQSSITSNTSEMTTNSATNTATPKPPAKSHPSSAHNPISEEHDQSLNPWGSSNENPEPVSSRVDQDGFEDGKDNSNGEGGDEEEEEDDEFGDFGGFEAPPPVVVSSPTLALNPSRLSRII
jgi:hypothetical protein